VHISYDDRVSASSDLRLPKFPVEVEVGFADGSSRCVDVYVAEHTEHSYRRQHVIDLLEADEPFVPARDVAENGHEHWAMINKATIAWVAIPLDEGSLPVDDSLDASDTELYDVQSPVSVDIAAHPAVAGHVLYSPPAGRGRLIDYLNQPGRFLRVWTAERLVLVNKSCVLGVHEPAVD